MSSNYRSKLLQWLSEVDIDPKILVESGNTVANYNDTYNELRKDIVSEESYYKHMQANVELLRFIKKLQREITLESEKGEKND